MTVILDRRGRVIAAFSHWCDAVVFIEQNPTHRYERTDEPGLDVQIAAWVGLPHVGEKPK